MLVIKKDKKVILDIEKAIEQEINTITEYKEFTLDCKTEKSHYSIVTKVTVYRGEYLVTIVKYIKGNKHTVKEYGKTFLADPGNLDYLLIANLSLIIINDAIA